MGNDGAGTIAVSPGPIATPILDKVFPDKNVAAHVREKTIGMIPMKRFGTSEEIAKAESVGWGRDTYGVEFEGPRRAGAAFVVLKHEPPKQQPLRLQENLHHRYLRRCLSLPP